MRCCCDRNPLAELPDVVWVVFFPTKSISVRYCNLQKTDSVPLRGLQHASERDQSHCELDLYDVRQQAQSSSLLNNPSH